MIKKLISKLFGIKECACPEDIEEPIILENEIVVEEKWKCGTHNRYKKSCSICRELAGVA
jgi:hypothetical protein|tara:strand:- start:71 stop:250 length:180 start_codon:yes stop_codon:yes gene_type:complete